MAVFADGQFALRCNRQAGTVSLVRSAAPGAATTMTIRTSDLARTVNTAPVAGGIGVDLPARDPLLDAMAFSKGRFAIEMAGMATLMVPSWTEVSRVVEDCR